MSINAIPLWKAPSDADLVSFFQSKGVSPSKCRELLRAHGIIKSVKSNADDLYREIARLDLNYGRLQNIVQVFSKTDDSRGRTVDETNFTMDVANVQRAIESLRKADAAQSIANPPRYELTLSGDAIVIEIEHKKIEAERTALLCQIKETSYVIIRPTKTGSTFTCDDTISQDVANSVKKELDTVDGRPPKEEYLSAENLSAQETRVFFDILTRTLEHPLGKRRIQTLKDVAEVSFKNARGIERDVRATSFQGTSGRARDLLNSDKVKEEIEQGFFISAVQWTTTLAISSDCVEEWDYRAGFKGKAKRFEFRLVEKRVGKTVDDLRRAVLTKGEIDALEIILLRTGHSALAQLKAAPRHL